MFVGPAPAGFGLALLLVFKGIFWVFSVEACAASELTNVKGAPAIMSQVKQKKTELVTIIFASRFHCSTRTNRHESSADNHQPSEDHRFRRLTGKTPPSGLED